MPRLPRLHVPGGFYHVMFRGNHREDIFNTAQDREVLNEIVAKSIAKVSARIHAFCWMTNHLHALVQVAESPLGKLMQRIGMHYARYRHRQLRIGGHLFENRHRALLVDTDAYFVAVLRYIHRNPVQAGIVSNVDDYQWSSHRAYAGFEVIPWLTIDFGLSLFGSTVEAARRNYGVLIHEEQFASEEYDLQNGHPDDPRVLGGDSFLASLPPPRVIPRSRLTLDELAKLVCDQMSASIEDVRSPSKRRSLCAVRVEIARRALEGRIASLHQVGRYLGRTPTAIGRLLDRRRRI